LRRWKGKKTFDEHCAMPYITHFFNDVQPGLVETFEVKLFPPPVAHSKHLAMEIDRGVTVVSPNFHLVADLYRQIGVEDVDNGVLGVKPVKIFLRDRVALICPLSILRMRRVAAVYISQSCSQFSR
jgi:hypothetical protein